MENKKTTIYINIIIRKSRYIFFYLNFQYLLKKKILKINKHYNDNYINIYIYI